MGLSSLTDVSGRGERLIVIKVKITNASSVLVGHCHSNPVKIISHRIDQDSRCFGEGRWGLLSVKSMHPVVFFSFHSRGIL